MGRGQHLQVGVLLKDLLDHFDQLLLGQWVETVVDIVEQQNLRTVKAEQHGKHLKFWMRTL